MTSRYEQFYLVISGIYRTINRIERVEMEKHGYKGSYVHYLNAVAKYEGATATDLEEICNIDKAAVSRSIAEMEQKGLVKRESGLNNYRRHYRAKIFLTEKGKEVAAMVHEKASAAVLAVGSTMSEDERKIVYSVLNRVFDELKTVSRSGIPDIE